jgi:hypothetical protein
MATLTAVNPIVSKGDHMETVSKLCTNSVSWSAGEFLYAVALGTISPIDAAQTVASGGVQYYALTDQADTGTDGATYAEVGVITPSTTFEGNIADAGTADEADVGKSYGLKVASNLVAIDKTDTTNLLVRITERASSYERIKNALADTSGRVRFRVTAIAVDGNL